MGIIQKTTSFFEKRVFKNPLLFYLYSLPYRYILYNEIKLAEICSEDRILNIGCGAIPFSAVHIAQLAGARVEAVDIDPEACREGQKNLQRLGLEEKITITQADGTSCEVGGFSVVLVALQAEPKNEIMQNLQLKADSGTRVVFRKPRAGFENQYQPLPENREVERRVFQPMITFNQSVLYRM